MQTTTGVTGTSGIAEQEALEIGIEAYHYFYPLVLMDVTRRQMTNAEPGRMPGFAPMNTFGHIRGLPTEFRAAPRPNFDTLYSPAWLDLTRGPVVVSTPDTAGRYFLLPIIDMWDEVFAAPGKRTTGTQAGHFAVVPPGWQGPLPAGVQTIQAPTPYVFVAGRTQTNGPADYEAVHQIQDGYTLTPLSQWGQQPQPVAFTPDPTVDMQTEPLQQVTRMPAADFFTYAGELLKLHPPHLTDWSLLARLRRIGITAGRSFDPAKLAPALRQTLADIPVLAMEQIQAKGAAFGRIVNGWQTITETIGVYGNNYLRRAWSAWIGIGFNQPEDAIYPINVADADGRPLSGENTYVLHFPKGELPPVGAFWSVTMYDSEGHIAANPLNRFALGDRDALRFNPDGSLDLYLQHSPPAADRESNWLPAPRGPLEVYLRLYAPKPAALDGTWNPPAITLTG